MSRVAAGALVGLAVGAALILVARHLLARRAPSLADRIGPYVPALRAATTSTARSGPATASLVELTGRWRRRDVAGLAARLARAGLPGDIAAYRLDQVVWGAGGGLLGSAFGLLLTARGAAGAGVVVLGLVGVVGGVVARDVALSRRVRRRRDAIEAALPQLADLVALAVTAGAGPVAALERAAAAMTGPLAEEVRECAGTIRSGAPAAGALRALAARTGVPAVDRLVDTLLLSAERGSPLAEVARAQAADARAAERQRLLELAGRKDLLMIVPIVFLVLPSVVLVAVFPGLATLRLVVP